MMSRERKDVCAAFHSPAILISAPKPALFLHPRGSACIQLLPPAWNILGQRYFVFQNLFCREEEPKPGHISRERGINQDFVYIGPKRASPHRPRGSPVCSRVQPHLDQTPPIGFLVLHRPLARHLSRGQVTSADVFGFLQSVQGGRVQGVAIDQADQVLFIVCPGSRGVGWKSR